MANYVPYSKTLMPYVKRVLAALDISPNVSISHQTLIKDFRVLDGWDSQGDWRWGERLKRAALLLFSGLRQIDQEIKIIALAIMIKEKEEIEKQQLQMIECKRESKFNSFKKARQKRRKRAKKPRPAGGLKGLAVQVPFRNNYNSFDLVKLKERMDGNS